MSMQSSVIIGPKIAAKNAYLNWPKEIPFVVLIVQ